MTDNSRDFQPDGDGERLPLPRLYDRHHTDGYRWPFSGQLVGPRVCFERETPVKSLVPRYTDDEQRASWKLTPAEQARIKSMINCRLGHDDPKEVEEEDSEEL